MNSAHIPHLPDHIVPIENKLNLYIKYIGHSLKTSKANFLYTYFYPFMEWQWSNHLSGSSVEWTWTYFKTVKLSAKNIEKV